MTEDPINHPVAKVAVTSGLAVFGYSIQDWLQVMSLISVGLAILSSLHILFDWWWKRFWKAYLIKKGKYPGKPRPYMDTTDHTPLEDK